MSTLCLMANIEKYSGKIFKYSGKDSNILKKIFKYSAQIFKYSGKYSNILIRYLYWNCKLCLRSVLDAMASEIEIWYGRDRAAALSSHCNTVLWRGTGASENCKYRVFVSTLTISAHAAIFRSGWVWMCGGLLAWGLPKSLQPLPTRLQALMTHGGLPNFKTHFLGGFQELQGGWNSLCCVWCDRKFTCTCCPPSTPSSG